MSKGHNKMMEYSTRTLSILMSMVTVWERSK